MHTYSIRSKRFWERWARPYLVLILAILFLIFVLYYMRWPWVSVNGFVKRCWIFETCEQHATRYRLHYPKHIGIHTTLTKTNEVQALLVDSSVRLRLMLGGINGNEYASPHYLPINYMIGTKAPIDWMTLYAFVPGDIPIDLYQSLRRDQSAIEKSGLSVAQQSALRLLLRREHLTLHASPIRSFVALTPVNRMGEPGPVAVIEIRFTIQEIHTVS